MKCTKLTIIYIFLLAFAVSVSAQDEKPKIIWKNLQDRYESFYDVKPILVNKSKQAVYFDCSDAEYGSFPNYGYDEAFKMFVKVDTNSWDWNVFACGTKTKKELKKIRKQTEKKRELIRRGEYIPVGCKLEPNGEYQIRISQKLWDNIIGIGGDPYAHYIYPAGKTYKFSLQYEWANATIPAISESPEFSINASEEEAK